MRYISRALFLLLLANLPSTGTIAAVSGNRNGIDTAVETAPERYFAVTLRTSLTPISDKQAKRDIPDRPVYLIQTKAFGKTVYNLRVGFFATFADAIAYRNGIRAKYPAASVFEIERNEYTVVLRSFPEFKLAVPKLEVKIPEPIVAPPVTPPPTPAPPAVSVGEYSPKALFAILLEESTQSISAVRSPLPESLKNFRLYITQTLIKDKPHYQLKLGFFEKEPDVFAARRNIMSTYPRAKVIRISLNEQTSSIRTALRAPSAPVVAKPTLPVPTPPVPTPKPSLVAPSVPKAMPGVTATPATSGDREAFALMEKGRAALASGDNSAAIAALDQLLRLPPNQYSQDAQEYIGLARQRAGDIPTARIEYELYLRLYPVGEGSDRVRQRVAALDAAKKPDTEVVLKPVKPRPEVLSTTSGSLSQYYYHGSSKLDTTTLSTTANTLNQATLTQTDQSSLVTNLNLIHRYRSENYDNRLVIRDTFTKNFLTGQKDINRPSSVYYEIKDRKINYSTRFGRQPGSSGGVLSRFDGVTAGYNFSPTWRANVVGGKPAEIPYDSDLNFYGTSVEMGPFADHWGGSLYTMQQKVDGVVDRNAIGSEIRFFHPVFAVYGLFDYDTEFQTPNITLMQGNWTGSRGTTAHVLYDKRKTPSLTLTNALLGETDTSIKSQLTTKSYEELKQQARDLTSTTDLISAGVAQTLTTRWQAGFSVQSIHTSSTAGTVNQPAQPDTGKVYTYTGNLVGTGLFSPRDVSVISVSHINAQTYDGNSYSLTNRVLWGANWSLDTTLSWYSQQDTSTDTKLRRFAPVLRPSYKWKENITLEAEFGEESTTTQSPTTDDKTNRRYWSLGYRWDF